MQHNTEGEVSSVSQPESGHNAQIPAIFFQEDRKIKAHKHTHTHVGAHNIPRGCTSQAAGFRVPALQ